MKTKLITALLLSFVLVPALGQEVTLFDSDGSARAYIDYSQEATIFLWDGTPVAFLKNDGRNMCVFGFNGNFLGWYEDGVIFDIKGNAVGARKGAVSMITKIEPIKGIQKITPIRPITSITPIKPIFSNRWSSSSLTELL